MGVGGVDARADGGYEAGSRVATVIITWPSRFRGIPPSEASTYVDSAIPADPKILAPASSAAICLVNSTALLSVIALMNTQSAPVCATVVASDR